MRRFVFVMLCLQLYCSGVPAYSSVESQVIVSASADVIRGHAVKGELYRQGADAVPVFLPGDTLYAGCLVRGFGHDHSGKHELTADFHLNGPEQTTIQVERRYAYTSGYSADNYRYVLLEPMLEYEVDGVPGRYVVRCVVHDEISGDQSICEQFYEVVATPQVRDFLLKPVETLEDIDDLWAMFFETSDPALVRKILPMLKWTTDGTPDRLVLGRAVEWSLTVNAARDARVLGICREFLAVCDHSIRGSLLRLINQAQGRESVQSR